MHTSPLEIKVDSKDIQEAKEAHLSVACSKAAAAAVLVSLGHKAH